MSRSRAATCSQPLRTAAEPLTGLRVAHISATAYGGGVSELLHSLVPLYRAPGLHCDWLVIPGTQRFFGSQRGPARRCDGRRDARSLPRLPAHDHDRAGRVVCTLLADRTQEETREAALAA